MSCKTKSALVPAKVNLWDYHKRDIFNLVMQSVETRPGLSAVYRGGSYQERLLSSIETANMDHLYHLWEKVSNLFSKEGSNGRGAQAGA